MLKICVMDGQIFPPSALAPERSTLAMSTYVLFTAELLDNNGARIVGDQVNQSTPALYLSWYEKPEIWPRECL